MSDATDEVRFTPPTLYVEYTAKSTQDRHASIPEQQEDCRRMGSENGWERIGGFSDEGFSAYSRNRGPGLEQAKRAAIKAAEESGQIVMLVAQAHDRFARGAGDKPGAPQSLGELWHELRRKNVWLRTVEDDEELRDEASVAAIGRRAFIDSQRKSKSIKKGHRRRARDRGLTIGGKRPFGFIDTKLDALIPAEAEAVRRIYDETIAGRSQSAVARALNRDGIRTSRGGLWTQTTVRHVLVNVVYKGYVTCDGEVYEGAHEGIVTEETWRAAEAIRLLQSGNRTGNRTRGAMKGGNNGGGRRPKGPHLFTHGLLRCGKCGEAMLPRTRHRKHGPDTEEYRCRGRTLLGDCDQEPVPRALLDEAVLDELSRRYLDVEETRSRLAARRDADVARAGELLAQAEREALRAGERLSRVVRDYQDGKLDVDDYREQRAGLIAEREAAEAAVEQAREQTTVPSYVDAEEETLRRLGELRAAVLGQLDAAPDLDALRTLIRQLFREVTLKHGELRCVPRVGVIDFAGLREAAALRKATGVGEKPSAHDFINRRPLDLAVSERPAKTDLLEASALFAPISLGGKR